MEGCPKGPWKDPQVCATDVKSMLAKNLQYSVVSCSRRACCPGEVSEPLSYVLGMILLMLVSSSTKSTIEELQHAHNACGFDFHWSSTWVCGWCSMESSEPGAKLITSLLE